MTKETLHLNMEYFFPFNGMFVLYLEPFCPKKINDGIQNLEN